MTFCQAGLPDTCRTFNLGAGHWYPRGKTGYIYDGDECRVVMKEKRIKARCKWRMHFSTPVGPAGATWELTVAPGFRYCAEASDTTGALVKKDDAKLWKAVKAAAPLACPVVPTPTPAPTPTPTATPVYGSASGAFVVQPPGLLR